MNIWLKKQYRILFLLMISIKYQKINLKLFQIKIFSGINTEEFIKDFSFFLNYIFFYFNLNSKYK